MNLLKAKDLFSRLNGMSYAYSIKEAHRVDWGPRVFWVNPDVRAFPACAIDTGANSVETILGVSGIVAGIDAGETASLVLRGDWNS